MLNVFKKIDGLRQSNGGAKVNGLEPPANLPDLARDMYEREQLAAIRAEPASSVKESAQKVSEQKSNAQIDTRNIILDSKNIPSNSKLLVEPNKDSVPRLDLSLVKQHIAASQAAIESIKPNQPDSHNLQYSQSIYGFEDKPAIQKSMSQGVSQPSFNDNMFNSMGMSTNIIDDSTGFFKELEEYVRNNGLDNDVINDLLSRDWFEHMLFYHTIKGEEAPFYASSSELSHAIKLKLENLQNFERNWVMNKQKLELLKKLGLTLETDIQSMSEELKKLMIESKKRNLAAKSGDLKSSGFFQLIKPKVNDNVSGNQDVNAVHMEASSIQTHPVDSANVFMHAAPLLQQNPYLPKYSLNKYIVHDAQKYFYAQNGHVFKSLSDLMDGLESMDLGTFNYHVNETKNDFSNWIKGVFGDFRLADAVRSLTDREKLWYYLKNNSN